jgi:hypothetical protein
MALRRSNERCEAKPFSKKIRAEHKDRNILEVFYHSESRAEFDAIAME